MQAEYVDGHALVDTAMLHAVTGRSPWVIRSICTRGPNGYDLDQSEAQLNAHPDEPVLLSAPEAQQYLGVPGGTVRYWASRGQLVSHDRDRQGRPLYDASQIQRLARRAQLDL